MLRLWPRIEPTISQWETPSSPRPKKARLVKSNLKAIQICFFDVRGVVHSEFVPLGQTVNRAFYLARDPICGRQIMVVFPPWQRSSTRSAARTPIFDWKRYNPCAPSTVYTRPAPLWLFISPNKKKTWQEGDLWTLINWRQKIDGDVVRHWRRWI